jgi:hypothetical protein
VIANPKTAGVARWIFLALWGHRMRRGDAAALDYVTRVRVLRVDRFVGGALPLKIHIQIPLILSPLPRRPPHTHTKGV